MFRKRLSGETYVLHELMARDIFMKLDYQTQLRNLIALFLATVFSTVEALEWDQELVDTHFQGVDQHIVHLYFDDTVELKEKLKLIVDQYDWSKFSSSYSNEEIEWIKSKYYNHNSMIWVVDSLIQMPFEKFSLVVKEDVELKRSSDRYALEQKEEIYHGTGGFFRSGNAFLISLNNEVYEELDIPQKTLPLSTCSDSSLLDWPGMQQKMVADKQLKNAIYSFISDFIPDAIFRVNDVFFDKNDAYVFLHSAKGSIDQAEFIELPFIKEVKEAYRFFIIPTDHGYAFGLPQGCFEITGGRTPLTRGSYPTH